MNLASDTFLPLEQLTKSVVAKKMPIIDVSKVTKHIDLSFDRDATIDLLKTKNIWVTQCLQPKKYAENTHYFEEEEDKEDEESDMSSHQSSAIEKYDDNEVEEIEKEREAETGRKISSDYSKELAERVLVKKLYQKIKSRNLFQDCLNIKIGVKNCVTVG